MFNYLDACVKIANNQAVNLKQLKEMLANDKKSVENWSYELFFKWLHLTKIEKQKAQSMRELSDVIKPDY